MTSLARRSAKRFFFSPARREGFRIPHLRGTDLLTDDDQFPDQVPETAVFGDLRLGPFDGGALGNDLGDRLSTNPMSQRIRRTMSGRVFPGAVAVRLATLTETRGQKTGTQVLDVGQTGRQLIASISQCLQWNGH